MAKETVVTKEGLLKLEQELEELKTIKRKEVAEKIKVARGFGDLSENSEYDEAKNEQAIVEGRIAELEAQLKNVRVLDESELGTENVHIGSVVTVRFKGKKTDVTYEIVGSTEANPLGGRISDESPIGKGLLGHAVGDTIEVETPGGEITLTIKKIDK
ncbi:MAG: transcription elongation factor GreA [Clostridia bacterium]|nr:transcription elongation factor GreA [Clostridia bacterium]